MGQWLSSPHKRDKIHLHDTNVRSFGYFAIMCKDMKIIRYRLYSSTSIIFIFLYDNQTFFSLIMMTLPTKTCTKFHHFHVIDKYKRQYVRKIDIDSPSGKHVRAIYTPLTPTFI